MKAARRALAAAPMAVLTGAPPAEDWRNLKPTPTCAAATDAGPLPALMEMEIGCVASLSRVVQRKALELIRVDGPRPVRPVTPVAVLTAVACDGRPPDARSPADVVAFSRPARDQR